MKTTKARPSTKKKTNTAPVPMKQRLNVVLHVRVPELQLQTLRHKGVDIPRLVRQAFDEAVASVLTNR